MDKSKVYTWLGFDSEKTEEVLHFIEQDNLRILSKKKLDRARGEILGKNNAAINKHKGILISSPNCEITKDIIESIKMARKANILYTQFKPYKDIFTKHNTCVQKPPIVQSPPLEEYFQEQPIEEQPCFEQIPMDCYDNRDFEKADKDYYIE